MKYTVKYLKSAAYLLALASMISVTGCKDDDNIYHPYDDVYSGDYAIFAGSGSTAEELVLDTNGMISELYANSISYDMFTNAGDWYIDYDYSACFNFDPNDSSKRWISAWPSEGNGDGRFTLKFSSNTLQGDTRHAKVNIISNGKILKTISVAQAGATTVRLNLVAAFMSVLTREYDYTEVISVPLDANVAWDAYVEYNDENDSNWIHLAEEQAPLNLRFNLDVNHSTSTRSATIVIYQISDSYNTVNITVNQHGIATE